MRFDVSWFKLNNCLNLAGQRRESPAYAALTDTDSDLPVANIAGAIGVSTADRILPTQYRYSTLIERARQLVDMAQQAEAAYLSFLEKHDVESYTILRARQDLGTTQANVALQDLRVIEAKDGEVLAQQQYDSVEAAFDYYSGLLFNQLIFGARRPRRYRTCGDCFALRNCRGRSHGRRRGKRNGSGGVLLFVLEWHGR